MLLLPIIGGLFVIETVSVIIQVPYASGLFGAARVFRMAPLHHHFELGGWPETTVIIRFWIIAGLFTAVALGIFYADFLAFREPSNEPSGCALWSRFATTGAVGGAPACAPWSRRDHRR